VHTNDKRTIQAGTTAKPTGKTYLGLFLTTLSLLQLELFLTRIYSVTIYYHFAFMAISLAMFGIAAGAIWVELGVRANPHDVLARSAVLYSASTALCFVLQLYIPVNPGKEVLFTALAFTVISIPFVLAGVVICVALTRFPEHTGPLYTADLAGSAVGCILTIPILNHIPAPTAMILNAGIAALGACIFGLASSKRIRWAAAGSCMLLLVVAGLNPSLRLVDLKWVKGKPYNPSGLYEKWNAFSRVWVGKATGPPFGWGISPKYQGHRVADQLWLNIDAGASTVITKFDGDVKEVDYLKHDVSSLAHYLRPNSSVLVIGVGGGRDILAALAFGQKRIVGVEINHDILNVLNSRYSAYSGNLNLRPEVTLVHDEARSFISRSKERFGIIQASLIDTWAATAAGAYTLTENGLYTKEAWITFLSHLTPDGILTMSRWESLRLASLAMASLLEMGVQTPRDHIMIVRTPNNLTGRLPSLATILVSLRPFTDDEISRIESVAQDSEFKLVLTPRFAESPDFSAVVDPVESRDLLRSYPFNISAPTDDSPFFFHMLRANDLFRPFKNQPLHYVQAVKVLEILLLIVTSLSLGAILLPLAINRRVRQGLSVPLLLYFGAIGLAFMLVEIGQLERLTLFLGHPIYGLSVVLFVLLSSSSLGSWCSSKLSGWIRMLPVVLAALIWLAPWTTQEFSTASTPVRIGISVSMLFPLGFLMGMAFPIGMQRARAHQESPTAWYWGINGALSVISSVLGMIIVVFWGIQATLLMGLCSYLFALAMLLIDRRGLAGSLN
jgi:hypothetical protein